MLDEGDLLRLVGTGQPEPEGRAAVLDALTGGSHTALRVVAPPCEECDPGDHHDWE